MVQRPNEFYNETTLISGLKRGNEDAFKQLYKLYYSELCIYTSSLCGNDELAKDIVQQTMIKIWKKGSELNINSSLKRYLLKSVYYKFIDIQRIKVKEDNLLNQLKKEVLLELTEISFEDLEKKHLLIETEIKNLPEQCKKVFLLGKKDGLKYREIAIKLNISIKTVERHMSLALKKLRRKLKTRSNPLTLFLISSAAISAKK